MSYTRPVGTAQSGFAVQRQPPPRQMLPARSRAATISTFVAAALVLYFAAFPKPWTKSSSQELKHVDAFQDPSSSAEVASTLIEGHVHTTQPKVQPQGTSRLQDAPDAMELVHSAAARALWDASSLPNPHKLLQGDGKELCRLLMPEGAESLAVVGNGPITDANRADIEAAGSVIRFNEMNSWLKTERVGVWAVRYNMREKHPFWGFWQLREGNQAGPLVEAASAVLVLGGGVQDTIPLLHAYPALVGKLYHLDYSDYRQLYSDFFSGGLNIKPYPPDPSSGLLALRHVVACALSSKSAVNLDVFGFNWSSKSDVTHMVLAEEHIVKQLLKLLEGDVTYHPTPCDGLRTCDTGCDDPFWTLRRNGTGNACKQMAEQKKAAAEKGSTEKKGSGELTPQDALAAVQQRHEETTEGAEHTLTDHDHLP
mmetsp:Transcript_18498/g.55785  ORF Transcript_18498/g.55785 Transcript_18498/m.55785 type:complete len:425 (-) Transcript_18498:1894-3168(-)